VLDLRRQQGATLQRIVYRLVQSLPGRKREEGTDLVYCLANGDISPEQMVMKVEFEYLPNERRAFCYLVPWHKELSALPIAIIICLPGMLLLIVMQMWVATFSGLTVFLLFGFHAAWKKRSTRTAISSFERSTWTISPDRLTTNWRSNSCAVCDGL